MDLSVEDLLYMWINSEFEFHISNPIERDNGEKRYAMKFCEIISFMI